MPGSAVRLLARSADESLIWFKRRTLSLAVRFLAGSANRAMWPDRAPWSQHMHHTVSYEGNGATRGSVPHAAYAKGRTVTVSRNKDGFTRNGATFAYWNTKRNGSGIFYGWPTNTTFTMPDQDVTLYAQWFVTSGLKHHGKTAHYAFAYDETLATDLHVEPDRTNKLIDDCERDYTLMSGWFGGKVTLDSVITVPIATYVTRLTGGARTTDSIRLLPGDNEVTTLRYLIVSELTEVFMQAQRLGWYATDGTDESFRGEGLSRFLGQQFLVATRTGVAEPGYGISYVWMNSGLPKNNASSTRYQAGQIKDPTDSKKQLATTIDYGARADYLKWVDHVGYVENVSGKKGHYTIEHDNGFTPDDACVLLFLYYLRTQLGYSVTDIVTNGPLFDPTADKNKPEVKAVYKNLTGDDGDPFPLFKHLLNANFPESTPANIPGPNPDNPFPLGSWGGLGTLSGTVADVDGDGRDEILVGSSWGIGILKKKNDSMTTIAIVANGTRLGEWALDTNHDRFGPVADFDGDGRDEIFVTSPWGAGILKYEAGGWKTLMTCANGTALGGGASLDTKTDQFGPVFDYGLFYVSSTGVGSLAWSPNLAASAFYPFGTNVFGWVPHPSDRIGPFGCFLDSNYGPSNVRSQFVVSTRSELYVIETQGGEWLPLTAIPNGTKLQGGWTIDTANDCYMLCGRYQYNPPPMDLILAISSSGIATLWFGIDAGQSPSPSTLVAGWHAKNGTDLGGWKLDTTKDRFGPSVYKVTRTRSGSTPNSYYTDYEPDYVVVTNDDGIRIIGMGVAGEVAATTWAVQANGDRLNGWILDTAHNHFGSAGRYDNARSELFVTSAWGAGILKIAGSLSNSVEVRVEPRTLTARMVQPNGTRLGEWVLDTIHNKF
jgi:hypothetical protein